MTSHSSSPSYNAWLAGFEHICKSIHNTAPKKTEGISYFIGLPENEIPDYLKEKHARISGQLKTPDKKLSYKGKH